jgi:hypothetical protein
MESEGPASLLVFWALVMVEGGKVARDSRAARDSRGLPAAVSSAGFLGD